MEGHQKSRLDLTKELLKGIRVPQSPPVGFDPLRATDDDLKLYGLPPRPDKTTHPLQSAKWEKVMKRPLTFVSPTFKIAEDEGSHPVHKSKNWCGAINTNLDPGDSFESVEADWIVPDPYPSKYDPHPYYKDGEYRVGTWIGIDGAGGSKDILQAGTGQRVKVVNHVKQEPTVRAWFEWYPAHAVFIDNYTVSPGDTMYGFVEAVTTTEGFAFFLNWQTEEYTSFSVPAPAGTKLKGTSVEWIVEDPSQSGSRAPIANFGSTFFNECYAITTKYEVKNLKDTELDVMVQDNITISVAEVENDHLLGVFYRG
jgi:hypothetical protein